MPHLHREDVLSSIQSLLPWNKKYLHEGTAKSEVESYLKNFFQVSSATCFDSGRSSLFVALKVLNIQKGDEVILQAYTCAVVSNAILWTGATPLYADIDESLTLDPNDVEQKITAKTKVLILQHTFGIPAHVEILKALAKKHNIIIIEDCAHVIGGTFQGQLLGTFGDIAMLSFGSEKPISCGRGGALLTNNEIFAKKIRNFEQSLVFAPDRIIQKQLMTNIYFWICKPLYRFGIGKFALGFLKKFHFLSRIIDESEKNGKNLSYYPSKFSNALAKIVLLQLTKLDHMNKKRIFLSNQYKAALKDLDIFHTKITYDQIPYLRFPLRIKNPKKFLEFAKKRGVLLGDWYASPLAPSDVDPSLMGYTKKMCPHAEKIATESVNLPTHDSLTPSDVTQIIDLVRTYVRKNN